MDQDETKRKAMFSVVKAVSERIRSAFEQIGQICDQQLEAPHSMGENQMKDEATGLIKYVLDNKKQLSEEYPLFAQIQIFNILIARWDQMDPQDKKVYFEDIQAIKKEKRFKKLKKSVNKSFQSIDLSLEEDEDQIKIVSKQEHESAQSSSGMKKLPFHLQFCLQTPDQIMEQQNLKEKTSRISELEEDAKKSQEQQKIESETYEHEEIAATRKQMKKKAETSELLLDQKQIKQLEISQGNEQKETKEKHDKNVPLEENKEEIEGRKIEQKEDDKNEEKNKISSLTPHTQSASQIKQLESHLPFPNPTENSEKQPLQHQQPSQRNLNNQIENSQISTIIPFTYRDHFHPQVTYSQDSQFVVATQTTQITSNPRDQQPNMVRRAETSYSEPNILHYDPIEELPSISSQIEHSNIEINKKTQECGIQTAQTAQKILESSEDNQVESRYPETIFQKKENRLEIDETEKSQIK